MNVSKLKGKMAEKGISVTKLCEDIVMTRSTMYRKLSSGKFTVSEATKIKEALKLTGTEAKSIFFDR